MAIITFTSDLGLTDPYVALVKARILQINSEAKIIDISHAIEPFNMAQAAFIIKSSFHQFPAGSIHLISVDSTGKKDEKFICVSLQKHFFLCTDNGLIGLISEQDPELKYELNHAQIQDKKGTFPERDVYAEAAARLSMGEKITSIAKPLETINRKLGRQLRATKNQIAGNVIYVDHYGNLVTNIEKSIFDTIRKDRTIRVTFAREQLDVISTSYSPSEEGDAVAVFNHQGLLEIAINKGNAAELLGMHYDSPVFIHFTPEL